MWKDLAIAGVFTIIAIGVPSKPNQAPSNKQQPAAQSHPVAIAATPAKQIDGDSNKGKPTSNPPHWYTPLKRPEWWLVVAAFVTCGVVCWQSIETASSARATKRSAVATEATVGVLESQSEILKESVAVARKSAEAAERNANAFINRERARLIVSMEIDKWFNVDVTAINRGRSPARITYGFVGCEIYGLKESFPATPNYTFGDDPAFYVQDEWLLPGQTDRIGGYDADYISDSENPELYADVMEGTLIVWFYGIVRYWDGVSEDEQSIAFCRKCHPSREGRHWLSDDGPEAYRRET